MLDRLRQSWHAQVPMLRTLGPIATLVRLVQQSNAKSSIVIAVAGMETLLTLAQRNGTSKGGMVVAIHKELGLPVKFVGLGEQPDDLPPFDAPQFAQALFEAP